MTYKEFYEKQNLSNQASKKRTYEKLSNQLGFVNISAVWLVFMITGLFIVPNMYSDISPICG